MLRRSALALLTIGLAGPAFAQAYPAKPITLIVPFAAGGPTDVIARIAADNMTRTLGQPIIIENIVGAGGTTASTRAAPSPCMTGLPRPRSGSRSSPRGRSSTTVLAS